MQNQDNSFTPDDMSDTTSNEEFATDTSLEKNHLSGDAVVRNITPEQAFNEDLIRLSVLMYQIDGKVTLTELDYFDSLLDSLNWRSGVSIDAFVNSAIHQGRVAIDSGTAREYLFSLGNGLNVDSARALEIAMDITEADGERCDEELELLSLLSNRVLTNGMVA